MGESVGRKGTKKSPVVLGSFLSQCAGCLNGMRDDPGHKDLKDTWECIPGAGSSTIEANQ